MALETDLIDQNLIMPLFNDSRLTGFDRLNENVLVALLANHSQKERETLLIMTVGDIWCLETASSQLKQDHCISDANFRHFEEKQKFYSQLRGVIEKRNKYIHKFV